MGRTPWNKGRHIRLNSGKTHFKKGQIAWNKGKRYKTGENSSKGKHLSLSTEFRKGIIPWNKDKKHWEYLYPAHTIDSKLLTQSERINLDKWFRPLSEPRWDKKRQQFTYPLFVIDVSQLIQPERTSLDKWIGSHPDFIWDRKRWQFTYPYLFIDPYLLTTSERIEMSKWFVELSRPPIRYKAKPWYYPYLSWYNKIIIAPMVIQSAHVHIDFFQSFLYQKVAEALKIFIYTWTRVAEGSSAFAKEAENTTSFSKIAKTTTIHTKTAKSTTLFTKEVEGGATWTKETEPPSVIEVPDN